jgi:hypothetical protein
METRMIITASSLQMGQPMLMRSSTTKQTAAPPGPVKVGPDGKAAPVQMASMPPVAESPKTGAAVAKPGQQANPIQMHGFYTNNPGFVESMNKAPWESPYFKASPPATTPVKPAKVNVQLAEGKLPYGRIAQKGKFHYDSVSEILPSPAPATPSFGSLAVQV